ncbi:MAG: 7-cyano-7-deazaguanine synthase, partial [Deltaproteobacteria bacterium]
MSLRSVVLLSSGLDSTVNFCKALRETEVVLSLTFDYGQRSAVSEISAAAKISEKYGIN